MFSSLEYLPQNARCPSGQPFQWLSLGTGALFPDECQRWKCPVCGPRRARRYARAFEHAGYERFATFTRLPADGRQGAARLAYNVRSGGFKLEWAWTAETGDKTGMRHVHALLRGDYIPHAYLSRCAVKAGFGEVTDIRRAELGHAHYAGKAWYASKMSEDAYAEWIDLNGGSRCWHVSRNYCKGVPLRSFVSEHARGSDPGPFVPYGSGLWFQGKRARALLRYNKPAALVFEQGDLELHDVGDDG